MEASGAACHSLVSSSQQCIRIVYAGAVLCERIRLALIVGMSVRALACSLVGAFICKFQPERHAA